MLQKLHVAYVAQKCVKRSQYEGLCIVTVFPGLSIFVSMLKQSLLVHVNVCNLHKCVYSMSVCVCVCVSCHHARGDAMRGLRGLRGGFSVAWFSIRALYKTNTHTAVIMTIIFDRIHMLNSVSYIL